MWCKLPICEGMWFDKMSDTPISCGLISCKKKCVIKYPAVAVTPGHDVQQNILTSCDMMPRQMKWKNGIWFKTMQMARCKVLYRFIPHQTHSPRPPQPLCKTHMLRGPFMCITKVTKVFARLVCTMCQWCFCCWRHVPRWIWSIWTKYIDMILYM